MKLSVPIAPLVAGLALAIALSGAALVINPSDQPTDSAATLPSPSGASSAQTIPSVSDQDAQVAAAQKVAVDYAIERYSYSWDETVDSRRSRLLSPDTLVTQEFINNVDLELGSAPPEQALIDDKMTRQSTVREDEIVVEKVSDLEIYVTLLVRSTFLNEAGVEIEQAPASKHTVALSLSAGQWLVTGEIVSY